eukprot:TRINITY_DN3828_c0_g1_i1.p1 TRINITY_DN3828_c0_g1~~TRINITY_DN3828_c0_g1_i1.p1  ORF type:complete len:277 (-),score=48.90 TRINITY_DN3828_c0_g1_i1:48-878(-)
MAEENERKGEAPSAENAMPASIEKECDSSLEKEGPKRSRDADDEDVEKRKLDEVGANVPAKRPKLSEHVNDEQINKENPNGEENEACEMAEEPDKKEDETVVSENEKDEEKTEQKNEGPIQLGPKTFNDSVKMFEYFYNLLHSWPLNLPFNKYEKLVLEDLLTKGHHEVQKKTGPGIKAFEVRLHPQWGTRCFCIIRSDHAIDDFSYRKCIDKLLPLPENMKISSNGIDKKCRNQPKLSGGRGHNIKGKNQNQANRGGFSGRGRGRHGGRGKGRSR